MDMPWYCSSMQTKLVARRRLSHRAGVHPGKAAAEELRVEAPLLKVHVVERRDLKFATGEGLHGNSQVTYEYPAFR